MLSGNFTCWFIDLPGFGQNAEKLTDKSPEGYADWVNKFATTNKIGKFSVLGHSFGGRVAAILAADNKSVQNAILYCSPLLKLKSKKGKLVSMGSKMGFKNIPLVSDLLRSADYKNTTPENREVFLEAVNFDLSSFLKKIHKPTLILAAERDHEVPLLVAQKAHAEILDSTLYVFPNASHFPHLENPYLFCSVVKKFLEENV